MKNDLGIFIPLELASKLNDKGIHISSLAYYDNKGELSIYPFNRLDLTPAPTWDQVKSWLFNNKILIQTLVIDSWTEWVYNILVEDCMAPFCVIKDYDFTNIHSTERECLVDAFNYVIDNIL